MNERTHVSSRAVSLLELQANLARTKVRLDQQVVVSIRQTIKGGERGCLAESSRDIGGRVGGCELGHARAKRVLGTSNSSKSDETTAVLRNRRHAVAV